MGRKRKDGDPLGLSGTRLSWRWNKFWYRHRDGRWEPVGTDVAEAKRLATVYNDPEGAYGTTGYWLDRFLLDCAARVRASDMSARTLKDYTSAVVELKVFFGRAAPETITPHMVQTYLEEGKRAGRATRANRERACLSSCLSWLIREGHTAMQVNPCMQASGVKRNPETHRDRYVPDSEYQAVYAVAPKTVRLMMELTYRTLQRPESDIIGWTPANIRQKAGGKVLRVEQNKTGRILEIALTGELLALVESAVGDVPVLHRPIVHKQRRRGKDEAYTYSGLDAMLRRAQKKARVKMPGLQPFGFRDLKGKGATDMWLAGVPIERIQALCGHKDKATTEIYVKQRWRESVASNDRKIGA
ncbi:site-specific integrase [Castellaniella sp.]|uniref:site-specific integrase n=1 Tax=Castellaniella sp. TaxID=1955812 RepID=UPI003C7651D7